MSRGNHCNLSIEAIHWLYGELLGDGCLPKRSRRATLFNYTSKYKEYIKYVRNTLNSFGIKQAGKIYKRYHSDMDCYTYNYVSLTYPELLTIRKKWYPEGKKIVPKDIELTPLVCRQWYIGDGQLEIREKHRPRIKLTTDSFSIPDVNWLVKQLNNLGFKTTRQPSTNRIYVPPYSVKNFLDYIGECPVKCYQYKWNYENGRKR